MTSGKKNFWAICAGVSLASLASVGAELGMQAPELSISQWIKGQPVQVSGGKGKGIYVVEFWATWCPPCRTSIPHLTELQKKYKDKGVVVIGISDEDARTVKPFVTKMGDKMDYVVAIDDNQKTTKAYMGAFGVTGIPHAFLIDRSGAIVWHGHPMGELDSVVGEVVSGRFDLAVAKRVENTLKLQEEYFELVGKPGKSPRASEIGNEIVTNFAKMPGALDEFSWRILADQKVKQRDLALALKAAHQAFEASQGKSPSVLDTYARALFDNGKHTEAIQYAKQAVALTKEEGQRLEYEARLNRYQRLAREMKK